MRLLFASREVIFQPQSYDRKGGGTVLVAAYAGLHFLVDMVCAWSMFSFFVEGNYENLLIYNFCAFALQMPFGTLLDLFRDRVRRLPATVAALGTVITAIGSLMHPAVLGIGNALFHVGGGVHVMEDDLMNDRKGALLGIFVAPGAVGLYLGSVLGKGAKGLLPVTIAVFLMICFLYPCFRQSKMPSGENPCHLSTGKMIPLILCCFVVVVIRSWIGLSVRFEWRSVAFFGVLAVVAAASGKAGGGLLAARFGIVRTAVISLILASLCYLGAQSPAFGLSALFFFNMSMPLTLYLLAKHLPAMAGFSFGLLTFGIFLGFVPVYLRMDMALNGNLAGALGSVVSCLLLIIAGKAGRYDKVSS